MKYQNLLSGKEKKKIFQNSSAAVFSQQAKH